MPEGLGLQFESPTGGALRFDWGPEAFAALDASTPSAEPVWTLGGELDWDEVDSLRVLSARLGDGRLLAVVALRPAGAQGHGDDLVAGAIGDGESFAGVDEPLLSTEYDAAGRPRRLGLELYPGEDGLALRIAADVSAVTSSAAGGAERVAAAITVRDPSGVGAGAFDLLTRA